MKIPKHMLAMTAIFKLKCDSIEQPSDTLAQTFTAASHTYTHILWHTDYSIFRSSSSCVHNAARLYFSVLNEKTRGLLLFLIHAASVEMPFAFSFHLVVTSGCVNLLMGYFIRSQQFINV